MQGVGAERATEHAVRITLVDHHGADQGVAAAHLDLRIVGRDALALGELEVGLPEILVARVLLRIAQLEIDARLDAQAAFLDAMFDHQARKAPLKRNIQGEEVGNDQSK